MNKTQNFIQLAIGFVSLVAFSFVFAAEVAQSPVEGDSVHIRTLAASCAACHGHMGNPVTVADTQKSLQLAGLEKHTIVERLENFKSGKANSTVMHHHAKGLTEAEILALADFFSAQKKSTKAALPNQPYQMPVAH